MTLWRIDTICDNAAMDWIGTASTAVVGLAGIVSTVWAGASGRHHQSRQAEIDAKSRIYASLFTQCDHTIDAIRHVWHLRKDNAAILSQAVASMQGARQKFNTAMYELQLICPPGVNDVSEELRSALRERASRAELGTDSDFSVRGIRRRLVDLMRTDLGYPTLGTARTNEAEPD